MSTAVDPAAQPSLGHGDTGRRTTTVAGAVLFLAILVTTLAWAKWVPYAHKIPAAAASGSLGVSILTGRQASAPSPSLEAAVSYAITYVGAIWPALVAGLLIAASLEAFLPPSLLFRLLAGRAWGSATLRGGACSMSSMMCTCCAAPIAVSMRRRGIPVAAVAAFWIGNPALNPAVLAFLALVLSWKWALLRAVSAVVLLALVGLVAHRLARPGSDLPEPGTADLRAANPRQALVRFVGTLARLCVTLLPEYLAIVLLLGAFRGWLFPASQSVAALGILAVVLFAVAGTLFVIPTAAEIPIIQGLLLAGLPIAPAATLLITLPAVSLPSLVMVARAFSVRATIAFAGLVVLVGVLTALAAPALGI
jgi:uncharacterized membrane protein YraQ (UPF0718 family)